VENAIVVVVVVVVIQYIYNTIQYNEYDFPVWSGN
jgi:hypothetical protein